MSDHSRRGFLAVAGIGAAAVGVTAISSPVGAAEDKPSVPSGAAGAVTAHVSDVKGDTVSLFVDEREVVVHDKDLVARLARAAH